ncbi:sel1 repeat family protein [Phaeovibrio sulfidiphilus]|uniref:Sel1 repeat family protein n=1 Tax=Phaeovibrio sulfidiphilus TaxID=1220600 RepID=A0A8J7CNV3_9PROT|nr:tetratricopeptide repeat protein [Phaeovibrio sulfidiphilus]MBE1236332.1 sel1 repeat family protein [Phaeovibrio sulfidiphilus]
MITSLLATAALCLVLLGHPGPGWAKPPQPDDARRLVEDGLAASSRGDSRTAFRAFEKADRAGDPEGSYLLGLQYMTGDGVARDTAKGLSLLRKASKKGNPFAPYALGGAYFYGSGVKRDLAEAARWYETGARRGDYRAGHMLGRLYSQGLGVEQDPIRGFAWCSTGAHASIAHTGSLECLIAVVEGLTPDQLREAEALGADYYMRHIVPNVGTVDILSGRTRPGRR